MRVGIVFHKNPVGPATGIDLVRLRALACGLGRRGMDVDIIAPVEKESCLTDAVTVYPLEILRRNEKRFDVVKTCYHFSIQLLGRYRGPVVSRMVRVVDHGLPERDANQRTRLLECQKLIAHRASALILNNVENAERWVGLYGNRLPVALIPTGCPSTIPPVQRNPFPAGKKAVLFLGSIAAPRMLWLLNETARRLGERCAVHVVGANKTHLYGGLEAEGMAPEIFRHGEIPEDETWDFIRHAHLGLAFATGPHGFDNDISKILSYLRGGLPVLSEELILNNHLVVGTGLGRIFRYGDVEDMAAKAVQLLEAPPPRQAREAAMEWMAGEHSWDVRAGVLADLLEKIGSRG